MGKIFIPCKQAATVSKAKKFGDIVVLHDQSDPAKDASPLGLEPDRLFAKFIRHLNTWEPGDLILLDGPLIYNAVATSILACFTNKISMLVWMKGRGDRGRRYHKRSFSLENVRPKKTWARKTSNRKVYAINNIHPPELARKYGEIVYLTEETLEESIPITNPSAIFKKVYPALAKSHKTDLLLLSGTRIESAVASSVLSRMHGTVDYLIFHHGRKKYLARSANFSKSRVKTMIRDRLKPNK